VVLAIGGATYADRHPHPPDPAGTMSVIAATGPVCQQVKRCDIGGVSLRVARDGTLTVDGDAVTPCPQHGLGWCYDERSNLPHHQSIRYGTIQEQTWRVVVRL
jgi:hypothetical protein